MTDINNTPTQAPLSEQTWNEAFPVPAVPHGWRLVPTEPTVAMLRAITGCDDEADAALGWAAALRVAPAVPGAPPVVDEREAFTNWAEIEYRHADQYDLRDFALGLSAWKARAALFGPLPPIAAAAEPASRETLPTAEMVVAGFEAVSLFQETDAYAAMSGCEGSAESARVCWAAMVGKIPSGAVPSQDFGPSDAQLRGAWAEASFARYSEDAAVPFAYLVLNRWGRAAQTGGQAQQDAEEERQRVGEALSAYLGGLAEDGVLTLDPFDAQNIDGILDAIDAARQGEGSAA